jgi:hypothetical protein
MCIPCGVTLLVVDKAILDLMPYALQVWCELVVVAPATAPLLALNPPTCLQYALLIC